MTAGGASSSRNARSWPPVRRRPTHPHRAPSGRASTQGEDLPGTLGWEELLAGTRPCAPPSRPTPDDGAAIIYTSGTTGRPKGVRPHPRQRGLEHPGRPSYICDIAKTTARSAFCRSTTPSARTSSSTPWSQSGGTLVLHRKFDLEEIARLRSSGITGHPLVRRSPHLHQASRSSPAHRAPSPPCATASRRRRRLPAEVARRWKERFGVADPRGVRPHGDHPLRLLQPRVPPQGGQRGDAHHERGDPDHRPVRGKTCPREPLAKSGSGART